MTIEVSYTRLKKAIKAFEDLQDEYSHLGANDTEPSACFRALMRRAVRGEAWQEPRDEAWQLFSSMPGWVKASQRLTAAAKRVHDAVRKSEHREVLETAEYYDWNV